MDSDQLQDDGESSGPCDSFIYDILKLALFAFGVPCNFLLIYLVHRRNMRFRSFAWSLIIFCIVNTCALSLSAFLAIDGLIAPKFGSIEAKLGPFGCKMYRLVPPIVQAASQWMMVAITSELFMAICYPFALRKCCSWPVARILLTGLMFTMIFAQIWRPFLDTKESTRVPRFVNGTLTFVEIPNAYCSPKKEFLRFYLNMDHFFHLMGLVFFLPITLILLMNFAVLLKLYQKRNARRRNERLHKSISRSATLGRSELTTLSKNNNTTAGHLITKSKLPGTRTLADKRTLSTCYLLTAVMLNFCFCILPHLSLMVSLRFIDLIKGPSYADAIFEGLCKVANAASLLTTLGNADNLFIFVIASDKLRAEFRQIFVKMARVCKPRPPRPSYQHRKSTIRQQSLAITNFSPDKDLREES